MARHTDLTERLRQVPQFSSLSRGDLKRVSAAGTHLHVPANWSLMSESTPADKAYVILDGEVAIRQRGKTVATVGAGSVVGEIGVLEHRLRTAGVVSLTELDVVHFTNEDLAELVEAIPALAAALQATARAHEAGDDTAS